MSKGSRRLALIVLFLPALEQSASAQPQSTVVAAAPALAEPGNSPANPAALPAVTVQAPHRSAKPAPPLSRRARSLPSSQPRSNSNRSTQPAEAASGAPNVASGPVGQPNMASQMTVTGEELNARPVTRPGEILEAVPGLIVTQHSGEGKANQYFLRGYNLDHGTDMAIWVDDVPINMRTHAHGQGYADLNWLMPETVNTLDIRKGPYFADEGDFASAGNLHIGLIDSVSRNIAEMTIGSFGYQRIFGMGSVKLGDGTLLYAGETGAYNGPWVNPDDMRKVNGLLRYTQGTASDGISITGMAYSNKWNSTDQVPQRAITSGQIGLYGEEDPTDGGNTDRFALSARVAGTDDAGSWKANAYVVKSDLDLFNDFTYFLTNPTQGDQFHQHDRPRRWPAGARRGRFNGSFAGRPMETTFGLQTRYDAIDLGLTDTFQRAFLSNVRSDKVGEASVGIYAQSTVHWTDWLRTTMGWRGDYYAARVDSLFDANNSGNASAAIGSPKFTAVRRSLQQDRTVLRRRLRHAQQRRARRDDHRGSGRPDPDPTAASSPSALAVAGADQGRGGRRSHQDRSGARLLGQRVHPRPGLRDRLQRRCRRHLGEPAQPALRHRVDQQIPPGFLARRSTPISRCRTRGLSASTASRPNFMRRWPVFRRRRSATRPATTSPTRRRWWPPPASPSARRPAGSERCAGAISAQARSPRTTRSGRRPPASSTAGSAIGSRMAGGSSSTCSICSTAGPTRSPMPMDR